MILGLDDSDKYATCLEGLEKGEPYCETSVLKLTEQDARSSVDCFLKPIDNLQVFKEAVKKRGLRLLNDRNYSPSLPPLRPETAYVSPEKMDQRIPFKQILPNRFPPPKENPTATFFDIPVEVMKKIFENETISAMLKVRATCKYFNSFFLDVLLSAFREIDVFACLPPSVPVEHVVVANSNYVDLCFRRSANGCPIRMKRDNDETLAIRIVIPIVDRDPVIFLTRITFTRIASYRGIRGKLLTGPADRRHQIGLRVSTRNLDPIGGYLGKPISWDDEYTPEFIILGTGSVIKVVMECIGTSTNVVTLEQFGGMLTQ